MRFDTLDVIAPGLLEAPCNEAEVLGSAVWLWMHSASHRDVPLHALSALLLPAIKQRQFVLATEHGKPVFFLIWAGLSPEAGAGIWPIRPSPCPRPIGPAASAPGSSTGSRRSAIRGAPAS